MIMTLLLWFQILVMLILTFVLWETHCELSMSPWIILCGPIGGIIGAISTDNFPSTIITTLFIMVAVQQLRLVKADYDEEKKGK